MSTNAIRITTTATIDKMETYRKNAPVLPRSRIPEKTKMKLCMSLNEADGMPSSCALAAPLSKASDDLARDQCILVK